MSENNLNEEIRVTVEDAPAITVNTPLVQNLTADNAAPTAKTVGDALEAKVDAEDVMEHVTITFDGIESDNQGVLLVSAEDIPLTDSTTVNPQTGAGSIKKDLERIYGKTAADIAYGLNVTVKDRIDTMAGTLGDVQSGMRGDEIPIDGTTGAQSVKEAIDEVDAKTAADIPYVTGTSVAEKIAAMDTAIAAVQTAAGSAVKVTAQSLTDGEKVQARTNIGAAGASDTVSVNAQTLTSTQQAQARTNIGALGAADVADAVRTSEQTLTTAQQAQARANIGAADAGSLAGMLKFTSYSYTLPSGTPAGGVLTITQTELGVTPPDGYSLIGILRFAIGDTSYCMTSMSASSIGNIYIQLINRSGSATTSSANFNVQLLWVRGAILE